MSSVTIKDIRELEAGMKKLEAADVDPEFKRRALEIFGETKALALEMLPLFLRGDELDKKINELVEKYPQFKNYL